MAGVGRASQVVIGVCLLGAACLSLFGDELSDLLSEADRLYAAKNEADNCDRALETFQMVLAIDLECEEAYWKLARCYFWLSRYRLTKESEKETACREGIEYAKLGVEVNERSAPSHFWLAANYGGYAQVKGAFESAALIEHIKAEMETVLELDENFEDGGAHRALGRLYFKLPGVMGGDLEKAGAHLARAVELSPQNPENRLFLGELYLERGREGEAKAHFEFVVTCPEVPSRLTWSRDLKAQARERLADMED